ncbi:inositol polyphosphate 5-phosphatase OCRL-like [Sycon ciliatum]|uniref:inositol polyphosphate 5-phosphatase OCRL-like n=1 Tax=Sycon ciliatum TaxID=27933 RepID=UPI0020AB584A|eukprot:scpid46326/ scgid10244/ Inositol polyphosphate 5-phosphatase OCRL-1; Lowe oculocerebrorenal syndrome protein
MDEVPTSVSLPDLKAHRRHVSPPKSNMLKRMRLAGKLNGRSAQRSKKPSIEEHSSTPKPHRNFSQLEDESRQLLRCRMAEREADYTKTQHLRVFCGTWNVNGKAPPASLRDFLLVDDPLPDVFVIGFQELDLRAEVLVLNETNREKEWISAIETTLGPSYAEVKTVRLVGMMLVVFVRQDMRELIHNVDAQTVGTGLMRKMGNKGGVSIRATFSMTPLCFVCSHLAAHQEEVERRNEDYHEILSRTTFDDGTGIADNDVILWVGDMNYRLISSSRVDDSAVRSIAVSDFSQLLDMDQLAREQLCGRTFQGFQEGPIVFPPSYKYDPGTDQFDSSEKWRMPAWCDRVLFRGEGVEVAKYRSHMELKTSDHKPVSALLRVPVKVSDPALEKEVFAEELFDMDRMANNRMPNVQLSAVELEFKDVKFFESEVQYIKVTNTGTVPCRFSFVNKLESAATIPPWLTIKPSFAILQPEKSMTLSFTVSVAANQLSWFNVQPQKDAILIFHLDGSRDFFLNISVNFQQTLFGRNLGELAIMTRTSSEGTLGATRCRASGFSLDSDTVLVSLHNSVVESDTADIDHPPRPLWALFDALGERGLETPALFIDGGRQSELVEIRNQLDNGNLDLRDVGVRSVGEALLVFLEALPEPLIPYRYHTACCTIICDKEACRTLVDSMPVIHLMAFTKLMMLLSLLFANAAQNQCNRASVLSAFANVIFRPSEEDETAKERVSREKKFIQFLNHFLSG